MLPRMTKTIHLQRYRGVLCLSCGICPAWIQLSLEEIWAKCEGQNWVHGSLIVYITAMSHLHSQGHIYLTCDCTIPSIYSMHVLQTAFMQNRCLIRFAVINVCLSFHRSHVRGQGFRLYGALIGRCGSAEATAMGDKCVCWMWKEWRGQTLFPASLSATQKFDALPQPLVAHMYMYPFLTVLHI